jgi:Uma2 family endonuclease
MTHYRETNTRPFLAPPMLKVTPARQSTWTAADLVERFGPIPLSRICHDPPPGCASQDDVQEIHAQCKRLFELVEGTLVEKVMGFTESVIAALLIELIGSFARQHDLGFVAGEAGLLRLAPDLVRIPDVSFLSWTSLSERKIPAVSFLEQAPDLAVEIISPGNTQQEMAAKLKDYFAHGSRLVWYVYPLPREVHAFTSPTDCTVLPEEATLTGGEVLPGFELPVKAIFADLQRVDA